DEGGCERCANREKYPSSQGYDLCICVHAEQNALLSAARFGIPVEGSVLYTTMRPCFGCAKELLQARVHAVYYLHDWRHPNEEMWRQYEMLERRFPGGAHRIQIPDPDRSEERRVGKEGRCRSVTRQCTACERQERSED